MRDMKSFLFFLLPIFFSSPQDFAEVFDVADLDCMHDAMNKLNDDSTKLNSQVCIILLIFLCFCSLCSH